MAWTALGNVRYLQQQFTAARIAYERALALSPELWTARNNLVQTLIAQGCPDQAQDWISGIGLPPIEMESVWARTLEELAAAGTGPCRSSEYVRNEPPRGN